MRLVYPWTDDPVCELSAQDRKLPMTNDEGGDINEISNKLSNKILNTSTHDGLFT